MLKFADWLNTSALNDALEPIAYWFIPAIQIVHIMSIAVVASSMILLNGRLIHSAVLRQSIPEAAHRFIPWVWWALALLLLSGCFMILMEPHRTLGKTTFWLKMGAVVLASLMTLALQRDVLRRSDYWTPSAHRPAMTALGAVNLALWVFVIFAGRWIAYA